MATERDLAQACRTAYRPWVNVCLWIIMEVLFPAMKQHFHHTSDLESPENPSDHLMTIKSLQTFQDSWTLSPPQWSRLRPALDAVCQPSYLPDLPARAKLRIVGSCVPQVAITATDLAEIIGSATAMYLLFGLPLWIGVLITAADVLFILFFGTHNFRLLEVGAQHRRLARARILSYCFAV